MDDPHVYDLSKQKNRVTFTVMGKCVGGANLGRKISLVLVMLSFVLDMLSLR